MRLSSFTGGTFRSECGEGLGCHPSQGVRVEGMGSEGLGCHASRGVLMEGMEGEG